MDELEEFKTGVVLMVASGEDGSLQPQLVRVILQAAKGDMPAQIRLMTRCVSA